MESTNVPDTYMDWDDEDEDEVRSELKPEDYRIRWRSVLQETVGMIGLQMLSNLTMLVPIFITGEFEFSIQAHDVVSSRKSDRETSGSPGQHWDIRRGGRGLRPADQPEVAAAHRPRLLRRRRPRPRLRLPQVAPPMEGHSAGGLLKI